MPHKPIPADFYNRDVAHVARDLLGKLLIRRTWEGTTVGRIVEAEAYLAEGDSACHSSRGKTRRNATMFGPPGRAYVYAIHARWCLNVVTQPEGVASAVLIRAVEPLAGLDLMRQRRGTEQPRDLARGPSRLCQAFAIDRLLDGWDVTRGRKLWIATGADDLGEHDPRGVQPEPPEILATPRIGVTSAKELPLRFVLAGHPFASGPRRGNRKNAPRPREPLP